MKAMTPVAIAVLFTTSAFGRPVRIWSYEDLFKEADVVAIVKVKKIADTTARLEGHGDPDQYQGKRAEVVVGLSLKGERKQTLSLDFFTYANKRGAPPDGAEFADLSKANKAHYLVFLKKAGDGTLIPVSGHYDADVSIREVASNSLIQIEDAPTKESAVH